MPVGPVACRQWRVPPLMLLGPSCWKGVLLLPLLLLQHVVLPAAGQLRLSLHLGRAVPVALLCLSVLALHAAWCEG